VPSRDLVNAPVSRFLTGQPGDITYVDLAYWMYVAQKRDGEPVAHVEAWYGHLSSLEAKEEARK
jgi:hypothetical protein